jgi:hypothetical protein
MSILVWYLLFALTTALTAMYELFIPVFKEYAILEPNDNLVQNKGLTYFIFFIFSVLVAPLLFPIVIIPAMSAWFKKSMLDTLTLEPTKI